MTENRHWLEKKAWNVFSVHVGRNGRHLTRLPYDLTMDAARINPLNPEQEGKNMARRLAPLKPQLHDFFLEHVHAPLVDAFSEFSNRETVSAVPLPEQIELLKTHVANKKKVLIRSQEDEINAIRQKGKAWRDEIDKIRRGLA